MIGRSRTCWANFAAAILLACVATAARADPPQGAADAPPSPQDAATAPWDADQRLPWHRTPHLPESPVRRLSSPREMLELFNLDDSQLRQLLDDRPLVPDEEETLWKILFRMPHFGTDKLHAWQRRDTRWTDLGDNPEEHRFQVFGLQGRVHNVRYVELPPEAAVRLEFDHYYLVDLELDAAAGPVQVACRYVPEAWRDRKTLDERAACLGLLLKTGQAGDAGVPLYFAAERVAWLPDRIDPELGVTADHVLLGELGMDAGLWDRLRQSNARRLLASDHEGFYQLLVAVDRAPAGTLLENASRKFDLAALLNDPSSQQGRLMTFTGTARRVQKIVVEDQAVRERFGIDHYYQIDVLVPLGDQEVRLVNDPQQMDAPVFRNTYPVHCCVLQLPPGLPDRPDVNQEVRLTGFYFKLWAYSTDYVKSFGSEQRQLSPLFIATAPQVIERRQASNPVWGWLGGAAFLAVLGAIALGGWYYHRSDRIVQERIRRKQYTLDPNQSLDDLARHVRDGPDFSHLDK